MLLKIACRRIIFFQHIIWFNALKVWKTPCMDRTRLPAPLNSCIMKSSPWKLPFFVNSFHSFLLLCILQWWVLSQYFRIYKHSTFLVDVPYYLVILISLFFVWIMNWVIRMIILGHLSCYSYGRYSTFFPDPLAIYICFFFMLEMPARYFSCLGNLFIVNQFIEIDMKYFRRDEKLFSLHIMSSIQEYKSEMSYNFKQ